MSSDMSELGAVGEKIERKISSFLCMFWIFFKENCICGEFGEIRFVFFCHPSDLGFFVILP